MRGMPFVAVGGGLLASALWMGCGLVGSGTAPVDGGPVPDAMGIPDTGMDVEVVRDAPEDRGQGMNDSGMSCVCIPPLPAMWSYVELARDQANDPCPPNFGATATKTYEGAAGAPATCTCANCMAPTAVSCSVTSVTLDHGNDNQCNDNTGKALTVSGATCGTTGAGYSVANNDNFVRATSGAPTFAATCAPPGAPTTAKGPITYTHQGRTCVSPQAFPMVMGCGATDVCAPVLPMNHEICIQRDGDVACDQPGWTGFKALVADAPAVDTRACGNGTCACGATGTCGTGMLGVWDVDSTCQNNPTETLAVDGVCRLEANIDNINLNSFRYQGAPQNAACAKTGAATPTGSVAPGGTVRTICCRT